MAPAGEVVLTSAGRAVFLDRDGVLVPETGLALTEPGQIHLLPGVPDALRTLRDAGFSLVVVTNQAVVARGLLTEPELLAIHVELADRIAAAGGPRPDAVYYCPHHPDADRPEYRTVCDCRKPRPGMLLRAAREQGLDLGASVMVGDRMTDVEAGRRAGCRTVLVRSPRSADSRIITPDPAPEGLAPDFEADDLFAAARIIVGRS